MKRDNPLWEIENYFWHRFKFLRFLYYIKGTLDIKSALQIHYPSKPKKIIHAQCICNSKFKHENSKEEN